MAGMTKSEREDLQRLTRQREKVLIAAAKQRTAELIADFESQMAARYDFDDDAVWEAAVKAVEPEINKAKERVAARCRELGIPRQFAPKLDLSWRHTGYANVIDAQKKELRRVAKTQADALEARAIVEIQKASLDAQTQLAVAGLTSEAARTFVERLPDVETLMPALSYDELAGESDPPIVEQVLTPNALRQRRFRDRQKALRTADVTPPEALRDGRDDGKDDGQGGAP